MHPPMIPGDQTGRGAVRSKREVIICLIAKSSQKVRKDRAGIALFFKDQKRSILPFEQSDFSKESSKKNHRFFFPYITIKELFGRSQ